MILAMRGLYRHLLQNGDILYVFQEAIDLGYYSAPFRSSRVSVPMQFLVDFFPLLLFLGTFLYTKDLMIGMQVLMVAMPIAFLLKWYITKSIDKMLLGSTVLLLLFGGISLAIGDPLYFKWKPTVFYWLAALVFFGSQFIGTKTITARMFSTVGRMPDKKWIKLNLAWVVFFVAAGFLNLYVAYNFSELVWANFKVFGFTGITFVFILGQMVWLMKHLEKEPGEQTEND